MSKRNILLLLFLSLWVAAFSQVKIEEVSLTNIADLNTQYEDFFAVPYGDGIMYNAIGAKNRCDTCGYLFGLRFASKKAGTDCDFEPAQVVTAMTILKKSNFNVPTFSSEEQMMYVTQNYRKQGGGKTNERESKLKIVSAQLDEDNDWVNFKDLPFNLVDYETAHPTLSADGNRLYFASDRPGGLGKMDIWMVHKQGDTWSTPVNLGSPINSPDNELFPSITDKEILYFSSNKAGGIGQLDIYKAIRTDSIWATINLGTPFNSTKDDLGYIKTTDGESGYLTSNRSGGKGKDDLYFWKVRTVPITLAVVDKRNTQPLPDSKIKIIELSKDSSITELITDSGGAQQFTITFRRKYRIQVEKEGYESWSKVVTAKELATTQPYIIPLVPKTQQLIATVKLLGSETTVSGSEIVLTNTQTNQTRKGITAADGTLSFDSIYCSTAYELVASKDEQTSKTFLLPATAIDCASDAPTEITLRLPVSPIVCDCSCFCNCHDAGMLSLPIGATPKQINALGTKPEFGNSHGLTALDFYIKLHRRYKRKSRDAIYLDKLFKTLGYDGFKNAPATIFSDAIIPNGRIGNMGFSKRHRIQYVQLNAKRSRDLKAFKIEAKNGCDIYFMKTCGNLFFFCNQEG